MEALVWGADRRRKGEDYERKPGMKSRLLLKCREEISGRSCIPGAGERTEGRSEREASQL